MTTADLPSPQMTINTVDEHDIVLGTIERRFVLPTCHNFRVAHVFLTNSRGEVLIQQLASPRERHPLAWGASVACYLFAGEDYESAIRRRVLQELGAAAEGLTLLGRTAMKDGESLKFIGVFTGRAEGPFTVDPLHIARVEFLPVDQLEAELESQSRPFTPTFRHVFPLARPFLRG